MKSSKLTPEQIEALLNFVGDCGTAGEAVLELGSTIKDASERLEYWSQAAAHLYAAATGPDRKNWARLPVDPRTFVESPRFLNQKHILYPEVMRCMTEMNSGQYVEAVLTGGIGTGKTTVALFSTAYQLYRLSCYESPHKLFNLDPSSEIVFIFQSLNAALAKTVDYQRFRAMIDQAPYFQTVFPYRSDIESELRFRNRILVKPVSGAAEAAIGQNVIGGIIDEVNFMAITENSKAAVGDERVFDQAKELYNSIVRRRKSRFSIRGNLPGLLCLVSSKRYPGEFTERKADEAARDIAEKGATRIYVYDKRVWEIKPAGSFTGSTFKVFPGDLTRKPAILSDAEFERMTESDQAWCLDLPEEYRDDFERDPLSAVRDIGGISTHAISPYFANPDRVAAGFDKVPGILSRPDCDFVDTSVAIYPKRFWEPSFPRWVHLDMSHSGDSFGIACGTVARFVSIERVERQKELLPVIRYDFLLRLNPPRNQEIPYDKVRGLIYKLTELGLNVRYVTSDQFQSTDMRQILGQRGYMTGQISVDVDRRAYDTLKNAFYDERVEAPAHEHCQVELVRLNWTDKSVDHPPSGSKDVADAMAGVAFGVTTRREYWHAFGIPPTRIPASILNMNEVGKTSVAAAVQRREQKERDARRSYLEIAKDEALVA
jgi:hypothetical protein